MAYGRDTVVRRLEQVGCTVAAATDVLTVTPPSWRPDLTDPQRPRRGGHPARGLRDHPGPRCRARPGRGLTAPQRLRRRVGRALAGAGYVEVLSYPFVGRGDLDALQLPGDDARRRRCGWPTRCPTRSRCCGPRCCPACCARWRRNVGRGFADVALFEIGPGLPARPGEPRGRRGSPVDRRPDAEELAALEAALPDQPRRVGGRAGRRAGAGRLVGSGPPGVWADAVEAARTVARGGRRRADGQGRPARAVAPGPLRGAARRRHPRRPRRRAAPARHQGVRASRADLRDGAGAAPAGPRPETVRAPHVSDYPVANQDVALIVDASVPAAEVEAALREGAGDLLEASGCSTSTPASRWARAASPWPTRCGSAPPTAPLPPRRCRRRATPPWRPRPSAPAPSCAAPDDRLTSAERAPGPCHGPGARRAAAPRGRALPLAASTRGHATVRCPGQAGTRAGRSRASQPVTPGRGPGPRRRPRRGGDAELGEDVRDVDAGGLRRDEQLRARSRGWTGRAPAAAAPRTRAR